jgi:hypothetical protein
VTTRNRRSSANSKTGIAILTERISDKIQRQEDWLEANRPLAGDYAPSARKAGPRNRLRERHNVFAPQNGDLHRLTWDYLKALLHFEPAPNTTWRDYAVEAIMHSLIRGEEHLADLASQADIRALEAYADLTLKMVRSLTHFSKTERDTLVPYAERQRQWPVLRSLHPHFDTANRAILESLGVGRCNPLNIYKGRWDPNDDVGTIALDTWEQLERIRLLPYPFGFQAWREWETNARKLPEFTEESWPRWYHVAEQHVQEVFSSKEDIDRLNAMITAPTRKNRSYKRGSLPKINSHFFTMLKEKFQSMAGCNRD